MAGKVSFYLKKASNFLTFENTLVSLLVVGNGESGLLAVQQNETRLSGSGSSRLTSQDIIRHPPRPSVRLESPNGIYFFQIKESHIIMHINILYMDILGLSGPRMLIALYDYNAREISDMSFRKGDRMELLDDRCVLQSLYYELCLISFSIL